MPTLRTLIDGLKPGTPTTSRNLRLVPLVWDGTPDPSIDYALACDALSRGDLTITEVCQEGVVAELLAVSTAEIPILLIDGEELVGAKQNRILNTDVLLRSGSKTKIPVSCVEQGRWGADRPDFEAGGYSPSSLRARKSKSVSRSLREENVARSDQSEVWEDVGSLLDGTGAASGTDAMAAVFEQRGDDLEMILRGLPCPEDAAGVIAIIDGEFAALDLFDRSATLTALWPRLIIGYAADALARGKPRMLCQCEIGASSLLGRIAAIDCDALPGVGLGSDWRFDSSEFAGSALVLEKRALHLSVFPGGLDQRDGKGAENRIASPRHRRRHGHGG